MFCRQQQLTANFVSTRRAPRPDEGISSRRRNWKSSRGLFVGSMADYKKVPLHLRL